MSIEIDSQYTFAYPVAFVTLPEYTAHRGQAVTVLRELGPDESESDEPMYEVRANDGWIGFAWESELADKTALILE